MRDVKVVNVVFDEQTGGGLGEGGGAGDGPSGAVRFSALLMAEGDFVKRLGSVRADGGSDRPVDPAVPPTPELFGYPSRFQERAIAFLVPPVDIRAPDFVSPQGFYPKAGVAVGLGEVELISGAPLRVAGLEFLFQ